MREFPGRHCQDSIKSRRAASSIPAGDCSAISQPSSPDYDEERFYKVSEHSLKPHISFRSTLLANHFHRSKVMQSLKSI